MLNSLNHKSAFLTTAFCVIKELVGFPAALSSSAQFAVKQFPKPNPVGTICTGLSTIGDFKIKHAQRDQRPAGDGEQSRHGFQFGANRQYNHILRL